MWRLLPFEAAPGAWNMAVDEALARSAGAGVSPPTLRLYGWARPCLSLGRFQRYETEVDEAACREGGVDVVRRPSGGRTLLHEHELTYSVAAAADDPLVAGSVVEAYARISGAILAGLRRLGVEAALAGRARRGDAARTRFGACFDSPSDYEVVAAGVRKLVGSAQWRHGGAVLQHGAVLLRADAGRFYRFARPPRGVDRAAAAEHLRDRVVGLDELAGRAVLPAEVASALAGGFAEVVGGDPAPGALAADEQALAERLAYEKYGSCGWTQERRESILND